MHLYRCFELWKTTFSFGCENPLWNLCIDALTNNTFLLQSEKTKSSPDAKEFKAVSLDNKEVQYS